MMSSDSQNSAEPQPNEQNNEGTVCTSQRFEEACEMMKQNAAKFLDSDLAPSSSEDELDEDLIVKRTLLQYNDCGNRSLEKTRELLQDLLTSGSTVCLICIASVKMTHKVWSCVNCYCMLHLSCIQKWAKDSLYHPDIEDGNKPTNWFCPKCRFSYKASEEPKKYLCFCGKKENPEFDTWRVPHSCGETCQKKLKPKCGHTCALLCHPGPCPPCSKIIAVSCGCDKSDPIARRCSTKAWSCRRVCAKPLPNCLHTCREPCHYGKCPPCKVEIEQTCLCGKEILQSPCGDSRRMCNNLCFKSLECGRHVCNSVCHDGPCVPCPDSGPRSCPCGKKVFYLPCSESVETCGDTCDKLLSCGLHSCSERCHFADCENCRQVVVMKCRCGQREKSVPCNKEFLCDIKCKRRRDCGKHFCNRKCCAGDCPPCEIICGRTLNCGNHKCSSICHSGPCYPCREVETITCRCGETRFTVPCGLKKSSAPPKCSVDCKLPSICHHPERHKHKCHFGPCPSCRLICGKPLDCGHTCSARCHSAVPTKVETKQKKEGPWDLINAVKIVIVNKPCPPCTTPVPTPCIGGHEMMELPCHEATVRSCGRPCGRMLSCGNHTCTKICHDVTGAPDLTKRSGMCEECYQPCKKERKPGCTHPCPAICHPGECRDCYQLIRLKCYCGMTDVYLSCFEMSSGDKVKIAETMCCGSRCPKQMPCGHNCYLQCHEGPCGTPENCRKKVALRCPCKRKKKEVQCSSQSSVVVECDEECEIALQSIREEERKKQLAQEAEENKKREEDYEFYLKKTGQKKKKRKKRATNQVQTSFRRNLFVYSAVLVVLISMVAFFMY